MYNTKYKTAPINPGKYEAIIRLITEEDLKTKSGERYTILKYGVSVLTDIGWAPVSFIFFKDDTHGSRYSDFLDALFEHFGGKEIYLEDHIGLHVIIATSILYSNGNEYAALDWYEPYEEYIDKLKSEQYEESYNDKEKLYEIEPDLNLDD